MLSTIPENRHPESLQRAIEVFDKHIQRRRYKSFTEKPLRDKNRDADRRKDDKEKPELAAISVLTATQDSRQRNGRLNLLFAILVMVYGQYLFLFDGQEKINQSMPAAYSALVNQFEGLLGKNNVRGTIQIDNSRLY